MTPTSESEVRLRLAAAIAGRRHALSLTQSQLAERCGLPRGYIADLEGARRNPSLRNLVRLANALEITLAVLLA